MFSYNKKFRIIRLTKLPLIEQNVYTFKLKQIENFFAKLSSKKIIDVDVTKQMAKQLMCLSQIFKFDDDTITKETLNDLNVKG